MIIYQLDDFSVRIAVQKIAKNANPQIEIFLNSQKKNIQKFRKKNIQKFRKKHSKIQKKNIQKFRKKHPKIQNLSKTKIHFQQTLIKYGTLKGGSTEAYFKNSKIPTYKTMASYMASTANAMANRKLGLQFFRILFVFFLCILK